MSSFTENQMIEGESCPIHSSHKITWVCLDPRCTSANAKSCLICVKNNHKKCHDEYVIEISEFAEKVVIIKSGFDSNKLAKVVSSSLYDHIGNFNTSLDQKRNDFLEILKVNSHSKTLNPQSIASMKKNLKIVVNKETEKIEVSSKIEITEENLAKSLENFNTKLEKFFTKFIDEFSKIKFVSIGGNGKLRAEDWLGHINIMVEEEGPCLTFTRGPEDGTSNYFCVLNSVPLSDSCTYKLTIQGICESDRFLDFGIVDKSRYDSIVSGDFINSFNSGAISFCGYSYGGGLTGVTKTSGSSDSNGYSVGENTYLEYNKGSEIKFYNESLSNNLVLSGLDASTEHYLFIVLYHKEAIALLEKLS